MIDKGRKWWRFDCEAHPSRLSNPRDNMDLNVHGRQVFTKEEQRSKTGSGTEVGKKSESKSIAVQKVPHRIPSVPARLRETSACHTCPKVSFLFSAATVVLLVVVICNDLEEMIYTGKTLRSATQGFMWTWLILTWSASWQMRTTFRK